MSRVAMTILVKNEADIIESNVRYHASKGVNCFLVMDNGSTDGTYDILESLKQEFDLNLISNPDGVYAQSLWMTRLAKEAQKSLGADFVISNDADEFWVIEDGLRYQDLLKKSDSIVTVSRSNSVFGEDILESDYHFLDAKYRVNKAIKYSTQEQVDVDNICMQLVSVGPKVIIKPKGLIRIKGGNHRAKHFNPLGRRKLSSLSVIHYPIRSYQHFLNNIKHRANLLKKGASMGYHYKRWVSHLEQGRLEEEFQRMVITASEQACLERVGIISKIGSKTFQDLQRFR